MALLASSSCELEQLITTIRSASFLEQISPSLDSLDLARPVEGSHAYQSKSNLGDLFLLIEATPTNTIKFESKTPQAHGVCDL